MTVPQPLIISVTLIQTTKQPSSAMCQASPNPPPSLQIPIGRASRTAALKLPAVSSPEACPTPAVRALSPSSRYGRCPTTLNNKRRNLRPQLTAAYPFKADLKTYRTQPHYWHSGRGSIGNHSTALCPLLSGLHIASNPSTSRPM